MLDSIFNLFRTIFTPGNFEPHNIHFADNPELLWLYAFANSFIALAYLLLPAELSYIYFKRRDFSFSWVFIVIAFFGVWCSMSHVMKVLVLWYPAYWLEGIVSLTTGTVSLVSFVGYAIAVPLILKLTGPQKLSETNRKLSEEIELRTKVEDNLARKSLELKSVKKDFIERNAELAKLNQILIERELAMVQMKKEIESLQQNTN